MDPECNFPMGSEAGGEADKKGGQGATPPRARSLVRPVPGAPGTLLCWEPAYFSGGVAFILLIGIWDTYSTVISLLSCLQTDLRNLSSSFSPAPHRRWPLPHFLPLLIWAGRLVSMGSCTVWPFGSGFYWCHISKHPPELW